MDILIKCFDLLTKHGQLILHNETHLDYTSNHVQDIAVDVHKAKRLARAGQELMLEHKFTKEQLEQKCLELRSLYRKLELIFTEKRQSLLKFLELYQTLDMVTRVR